MRYLAASTGLLCSRCLLQRGPAKLCVEITAVEITAASWHAAVLEKADYSSWCSDWQSCSFAPDRQGVLVRRCAISAALILHEAWCLLGQSGRRESQARIRSFEFEAEFSEGASYEEDIYMMSANGPIRQGRNESRSATGAAISPEP